MSSHLPSVTTPPLAARLAAAEAARQAKESERDRDLHPAVVSALSEAGFLRQFVPRRWSGSAGTFAEIIEAVAVVGEECPSAAWCAALLAAHGRLAAHLPQEAQEELWQESPDVSIAAAVVPPSGELAKAPGGWRLSGRWAMASAVRHARWVLLACVEETPKVPASASSPYRAPTCGSTTPGAMPDCAAPAATPSAWTAPSYPHTAP